MWPVCQCPNAMRRPPPTYATTFNRFYSIIHRRKSVRTWVRRTVLSHRKHISDRIRITRHLLRIRETQSTGGHIDPATHSLVVSMQRSLTLGWIINHLRPLQRQIIRYLWRPGGPLQIRHMDALFRSMQREGSLAVAEVARHAE